MTDEMLALAQENKRKSGLANVHFLKGDIEHIPLPANSVDVIIYNFVINLAADKDRVLAEAFRVLKLGGRFAVSDVIVRGEVPDAMRRNMELWIRLRGRGAVRPRLEHLAAANGITHARAHDALSDVEALIDLARTMRKAQPKLFDYYLGFRRKARTQSLLNIAEHTPVLHVSGRFSAANGCAAIVAPLCIHPDIPNRVIVLDLLPDPSALANMRADDIRDRLYTPLADLPEGESRVALKEVHLNRCPALVELKHVSDSELQRLGLDRQVALGNVQKIRQMSGLIPRVREVFHCPVSDGPAFTTAPRDPDQSLYDGFISDADKQQCLAIRHQRLQRLMNMTPEFRDPRLLALWPRYLARNAPDSLSPTQRDAWTAYLRQRLTTDSGLSEYSIQSYFDSITELRRQHVADSEPHRLLDALEAWGRELQREID